MNELDHPDAVLARRSPPGVASRLSAALTRSAHAAALRLYALFAVFPAYLTWIPLRLNHLAALITVGTFALLALTSKRVPRISSGPVAVGKLLVVYGCLAIAGSAVLSSLVAIDPLDSLSFALRYLLGAVLVIAVAAYATDLSARIKGVTNALLLGGSASSLLAILGYWLPALGAVTIGVSRRAEALFDHPNQFGMVVLALVPIALAHALAAPRRPLPWLLTGVLVTGVILSGSFANTLLLLLAILLVFVTAPVRKWSLKRLVGGLAIVLVLAGAIALLGPERLLAASPRVADMLAAVQETGELEDRLPSVDERLGLYRVALETWRENPLLGIGADNADHFLVRPSGNPVGHAHNLFLNTAMSTGLVGMAALLLLVGGWLLVALELLVGRGSDHRHRHLARGVGTALILLFLSNQSSDSLSGTVTYPLWVLLGIAFALIDVHRTSERGQ